MKIPDAAYRFQSASYHANNATYHLKNASYRKTIDNKDKKEYNKNEVL